MRWFVVIPVWLILIFAGVKPVGMIAHHYKPDLEFGAGAEPAIDRIDWSTVTHPLEHTRARLALQSAFLARPLGPRSFAILLAAETEAATQPALRERLAGHLIRISPRNEAARLARADLQFQKGNFQQTAEEISRLIELDRGNAADYLNVLVAMAKEPAARPAIERLLEGQPGWGNQFVVLLSKEIDDLPFLVAAARRYPSSQASIISGLAAKGHLDLAYTVFLDFLDSEALSSMSVPFDSGFEGHVGAPPFNWSINNNFASREQSGGLSVSFFGQGRPMIAQQILALSPGAYSAEFLMQGDIFERGGRFEWSLGCHNAKDTLFAMPVSELRSTWHAYTASFDVPRGDCDFQVLRLSGVAGEFPRTARAQVQTVTITPQTEGDPL